MFSAQIFQENTFLKIKLNFSLTRKYFLLINFFNDKQIQKNFKNNFSKTTFHKTDGVVNRAYSAPFFITRLWEAVFHFSTSSLLRRVFWNNIFLFRITTSNRRFHFWFVLDYFLNLNTIFEFKFYLEFKSIPSKELQTQLI